MITALEREGKSPIGFSPRLAEIIRNTGEIARGHPTITTSHLAAELLGTKEMRGILGNFTQDSCAVARNVQFEVKNLMLEILPNPNVTPRNSSKLDLVFDLGRTIAENDGRFQIEVDDVVEAMFREGENVFVSLLGKYGVSLARIQELKKK